MVGIFKDSMEFARIVGVDLKYVYLEYKFIPFRVPYDADEIVDVMMHISEGNHLVLVNLDTKKILYV
ncbi:hypothetical protein [Listeria booriae]|uniref:Uncharacterized protein n=1 Tax=Listeria booriae TaxID=1552123 RepID=A0A7X0ZY09_9LIST|nr:hypothetical protein [Listeria booriae]MBC1780541.1 hypothetical protein [Listeria booriae]MBC2080885.1 hypothetical protein [Listeria booriae]MBC2149715.1 hypothetical protein [Listeria booriae]MBC2312065.1 hypothetical protein [Listeria booriae]MBC2324608.1 hypothetical protein [Listeria booriae]